MKGAGAIIEGYTKCFWKTGGTELDELCQV